MVLKRKRSARRAAGCAARLFSLVLWQAQRLPTTNTPTALQLHLHLPWISMVFRTTMLADYAAVHNPQQHNGSPFTSCSIMWHHVTLTVLKRVTRDGPSATVINDACFLQLKGSKRVSMVLLFGCGSGIQCTLRRTLKAKCQSRQAVSDPPDFLEERLRDQRFSHTARHCLAKVFSSLAELLGLSASRCLENSWLGSLLLGVGCRQSQPADGINTLSVWMQTWFWMFWFCVLGCAGVLIVTKTRGDQLSKCLVSRQAAFAHQSHPLSIPLERRHHRVSPWLEFDMDCNCNPAMC